MIVVGTAGHIDHGKTTLVKRLTGIETDRLKEEQERGISIELGFAYLDLPDKSRIGIIDVPGHERFVHHMISGASGVDLVLLVIAADEGVMPQTREHLLICQLLGMKKGIVILSKVDLVDDDWRTLVQDDIRASLAGSFLAEAPILEFSAAWEGPRLELFKKDLLNSIHTALAEVEKSSLHRPFVMPIDRVFTIRGFGTVVTGTIMTGALSVGDSVSLLPPGIETRVRRLEVHGRPAEHSTAGTRTAVNIPDVAKENVERGFVLAQSSLVRATSHLTVSLEFVPTLEVTLKRQFPVLFHCGAAMIEASVRLLDRKEASAGDRCLAAVRLSRPAVVVGGQRFIARGFSEVADFGKTLGGGAVLWPRQLRVRDASLADLQSLLSTSPLTVLEAMTRLAGPNGLPAASTPVLTPLPIADPAQMAQASEGKVLQLSTPDKRLIHVDHWNALKARIERILTQYHKTQPRKKGMPKEELKSRMPDYLDRPLVDAAVGYMTKTQELWTSDRLIALPWFQAVDDDAFTKLLDTIAKAVLDAGLEPPDRSELLTLFSASQPDISDAVARLVEDRVFVRVSSDLVFHSSVIDSVQNRILAFFKTNDTMTTQQLKELLNLSRKYLIPIAEYFDSIKLTVRSGPSERKLRQSH